MLVFCSCLHRREKWTTKVCTGRSLFGRTKSHHQASLPTPSSCHLQFRSRRNRSMEPPTSAPPTKTASTAEERLLFSQETSNRMTSVWKTRLSTGFEQMLKALTHFKASNNSFDWCFRTFTKTTEQRNEIWFVRPITPLLPGSLTVAPTTTTSSTIKKRRGWAVS